VNVQGPMNRAEQSSLAQLVLKGEGQVLEFKKSLSLRREGLEALCAMVNSDLAQGTVLFGIGPDGSVCGIEKGNLDTAQRSLSQVIRNKFEPSLVVKMQVEELANQRVLAISAERHRETPYHEYDGRAWIREGTTNRLLSLAEKESLAGKRNRDRHPGPWRCNLCGRWVGVLHSYEISGDGMKKTYGCECGGEFWPAT
jgi:predicted HTH transcriptional regulator